MLPEIVPLVIAAPALGWMAVSDFARMRIPNALILVLLAIFALGAPVLLSGHEFAWRLAAAAVVLGLGFIAFLGGAFAGGDVKALAALQLFIPAGREVLALYGLTLSAAMLAGIAAMLVLRHRLGHPGSAFASLAVARGYPMGVSIALAGLVFPLVYTQF